ncbi:MAG: DUF177 domain-containing protein [Burkholderiales bacterium]
MTLRAFDPVSLDIATFARQGGEALGTWPIAALNRLLDEAHADAQPAASEQVEWQARGETRSRRGGEPQIWLHLTCRTRLALICQRCLQPVDTEVHAQRSFQFVADEALAAKIDADSEEDVLALSRTLNLIELVEDELLLALPLAPRHPACTQPLSPSQEAEPFEERPNPFAVLGDLKRKSMPN